MAGLSEWKIDESAYPKGGSLYGKIKFILQYAILAPSGHNTQPWKVKIEEDVVKVFIDLGRSLKEMDPEGREMHLSLGAFIANLIIAAGHFGFKANVKYFPNRRRRDLIADIQMSEAGRGGGDSVNLSAITKRRNNRDTYINKMFDENVFERWRILAKSRDIELHLVTDSELKARLGELTGEGIKMAFSDIKFRKELAGWMRSNSPSVKDGIPINTTDIPIPPFIAPSMIRWFNIGIFKAKKDSKKIACAPVICVLSSRKDDKKSWVRVGEIFEYISLDAADIGASTAVFAAAIEEGLLYKEIMKVLRTSFRPQMLFTAGYPKRLLPHSPRRGLEEILIS